jgi:hypothetical protein
MSTVEIQPSTSAKPAPKIAPFDSNEGPPVRPPPLPPRPGAAPPLPPRPSAPPTVPPRTDVHEDNEKPASEQVDKLPEVTHEQKAPQPASVSNGTVRNAPEKPKTLQMDKKPSIPSTLNSIAAEPVKHYLYKELISK